MAALNDFEDMKNYLTDEEIAKLQNGGGKEQKDKEIKDGYLLAINHQFFIPNQGDINNNVMTIQEVNGLRKILQKILPEGYESGLTYIKTSNAVLEFVHTSDLKYILNEILPNTTHLSMNPKNLPNAKFFNPFSNEAAPFTVTDLPNLF